MLINSFNKRRLKQKLGKLLIANICVFSSGIETSKRVNITMGCVYLGILTDKTRPILPRQVTRNRDKGVISAIYGYIWKTSIDAIDSTLTYVRTYLPTFDYNTQWNNKTYFNVNGWYSIFGLCNCLGNK